MHAVGFTAVSPRFQHLARQSSCRLVTAGPRVHGEAVGTRVTGAILLPFPLGFPHDAEAATAAPTEAPSLPGEKATLLLKGGQLANLVCPTFQDVMEQAEPGIEHAQHTPHLAYSFLRRTGLSVS